MTQKHIIWWKPSVGERESGLINEVLTSGFINDGEYTTAFEKKFAETVGTKHAIAVTSGTTALFLAMKALGVGHGDEVIVPVLTFIATANAVSLCGATPVFVDVDLETGTIDSSQIELAITERTKAIVPVHVSGRAADMATIQALAQKHGLVVIEDAAEALLSKYQGKNLGTIGNAGCFSFSPNKTITTGQGGMVVTDDDEIEIALRELKDQGRYARGTGGADIHRVLGYNFKFSNILAAVGLAQLEQLPHRVARMKEINQIYQKQLADVPQVTLFPCDLEHGATPQWTDILVDDRDVLDNALRAKGVDCRRFWFPICTQAPYKQPIESFPNAESVSRRALWVPSCFSILNQEILQTAEYIKEFYT